MRRLRGNGLTLTNGREASPPAPFVEVEDREAEALKALYGASIIDVTDEGDGEPESSEGEGSEGGEQDSEPEADADEGAAGGADEGAAEGDAGDGGQADEGATGEGEGSAESATADGEGEGEGGEDPIAEVLAAIELLDPAKDFVKTGKRKGKPEVDAVSDALGREVTAEEIDAALATREAA
jgi:hypothetical protein